MTATPDTPWILRGAERLDRRVGIVKWFSPARGYGFIVAVGDPRGTELFFHHSEAHGGRHFNDGDPVSFRIVNGPKGAAAREVRLADSPLPEDLGT